MARLEQHHCGRDDLRFGQGVAFVLDLDQRRNKQAIGIGPLLGDERLRVVDVFTRGLVGGRLHLVCR
ncbi:MAG: hypothetical protein R2706_06360 [Acidimicrobiales bacterium]